MKKPRSRKSKPEASPKSKSISTRIEATAEEYTMFLMAATSQGVTPRVLLGSILRGWLAKWESK